MKYILLLLPAIFFAILGIGINYFGWFSIDLPYKTPYYLMIGMFFVAIIQILKANNFKGKRRV